MKKNIFSLLLAIILLTSLPGYGMQKKKSYSPEIKAKIDAILDSPDFLKDLEEGKHSDVKVFFCLIQRAIEEDKKAKVDALLKYLKTSPHFRRDAKNFTKTLIFAITKSNKLLIKAIFLHPEFKEIYIPSRSAFSASFLKIHYPSYRPKTTLKQILNHAIVKKNEIAIQTILECLEDIFANPCTSDICYTILTYAKKIKHDWIIPLIPDNPHPDNFNKLLLRAILERNDFITKLILDHPEFKPDFINEEILKHLYDPQFKPKKAVDILMYAIENQKELLSKVMLKYLEDNPKFKLNDFKQIIKAALEHEKDGENDFIIETILKHHQEKNCHVRIMGEFEFLRGASGLYSDSWREILILGIQHKKEYITKTMSKYLEKTKNLRNFKDFLICAIKYKNDLIVTTVLEHPDFKPHAPYRGTLSDYLREVLICAIKYKNDLIVTTVLEHPDFKPHAPYRGTLSDYLREVLICAIKHYNDFAIKEILKHPKFATISLGLRWYKKLLDHALDNKNLPAIEIFVKHPESKKLDSWNIEPIFILAMECNKTPIIEEMLKHPKFELSSNIINKIFAPAIEYNNKIAIKILLDILENPKNKVYGYNLIKLLEHAYENDRIIHAILKNKNFTVYELEKILIDAIEKKHELVITIMLKYLENELDKQDLSSKCFHILFHAIKHENTLVKKTLLSEPYAKNFNKILFYAILSPRKSSVIDALLQHPHYKPDFVLEEVLKHLQDPEFKPKDLKDILIYASKNQKDSLIRVMLKYLKMKKIRFHHTYSVIKTAVKYNNIFAIETMINLEKPKYLKNACVYTIKKAMELNNDFVIKIMLKKMENPIFQPEKVSSFHSTIIQYVMRNKSESLIQAILKYLDHNIITQNGTEHKNELTIQAILKHPQFKIDSDYYIEDVLKAAIEHKNKFVIKKMLEHPQFKPELRHIRDILIKATEHKNKFAIKKILEHPQFHPKAIWDKRKYDILNDTEGYISRFLSFIIKTINTEKPEFKVETINTEKPEFKVETNILEKYRIFTISTPTLKYCEIKIKLLYDIEKKEPLKINLLDRTFSLKRFPFGKKPIDELAIAIHPYFERAILLPKIQKKKEPLIIAMLNYLENYPKFRDDEGVDINILEMILKYAIEYENLPIINTILEMNTTPKYDTACKLKSMFKKELKDLIRKKILHKLNPKNFDKMLMYAILSPRDTSVIDALLGHPQYKPNFILKEIVKHLQDFPHYIPELPVDILIYAIENQKDNLIKVMLKYLEDHPIFKPNVSKLKGGGLSICTGSLERVIKTAVKYQKDYVIEPFLKLLENPHLQTVLYSSDRSAILNFGIKRKKEFIVQTMLKNLWTINPWHLEKFYVLQ